MYYIYIDQLERLEFFKRFYTEQYSLKFFTCRYSVYLKGRSLGLDIYIVKRVVRNANKHHDYSVIERSRDYLAGFVSKKDAVNIIDSILYFMSALALDEINGIILWNGTDVAERSIAQYSKINNISLMFMEISNLPNRLFIDPLGVNAESTLFYLDDMSKIKNLKNNKNQSYADYIQELESIKSGKYIPPQSKKTSKVNVLFIVDYLYSLFRGVKFQSNGFLSKFENIKLRLLSKNNVTGEYCDLTKNYIFLPLQVSNDSQILLNSDLNNLDAIEIGIKLASKNNVELFVKIHPAEKNTNIIDSYKKLSTDNDFKLVLNNTDELIDNAKVVVTINSTVGFESLLKNKKTIFLGRSFYSKLKGETIQHYIDNYLYECEYFSDERVFFDALLEHYKGLESTLVL